MRVLILTNMYPLPDDQTFGSFVAEQERALRAIGMDVDVLFVNGRANRLNYFRGIPRYWKQIRKGNYDVVHAHYVYSGWIARMQRRLPVVVSFHGAGEMVGHEGWLCRRLAPLVDASILTSKEHKAQFGYEPGRVISCGVDTKVFKPMPKAEARAQLGWNADSKIMMFVGAPRPEKRLDIIQAAYDILKSRRDDVEFKHVNGVPQRNLPVYMNAADVLVLASDREGAPGVIKEAMACNLPIVSVDVGDVIEVIGDTEGCFICERDPQDLAAKVDMVFRAGKRTNGRDRISHLDSERIAERVVEVYKEVIGRKAR